MTAARPVEVIESALRAVLLGLAPRIVACSGGVDSLLLATVAHAADPGATVVAHTVTPAVPSDGTARVMSYARQQGWKLEVVRSREFDDERYLSNPTDRCYYCKTNLYDAVSDLCNSAAAPPGSIVLSGANLDDLGEYRPGLIAADEHDVRHPFVEAEMSKAEIRVLAAHFGLDAAELPASPCLASRLYTGTRVTAERLQAIEVGEAVVRATGITVARCRIKDRTVLIEVPDADRVAVTAEVLQDVATAMRAAEPSIESVELDTRSYRPGQAVLHIN